VTSGTGLEPAEEFLASFNLEDITAQGYEMAVTYWEVTRPAPTWHTPTLLRLYTEDAAATFGKYLATDNAPIKDSLGFVDYKSPETIVSMRRIFWKFATYYDNPKDQSKRLMAASLRLYALLPLGTHESDDTHFYSAALLPSTFWVEQKYQELSSKRATFVRAPDDGLWLVSATRTG
jgi:hypothetical protein